MSNNWNSERRKKEKFKKLLGYLPTGWRDMDFMDIEYKCISLAPLPTATSVRSKAVPCIPQVGPDPETHDTVNFDWVPCSYGWKCQAKEKGNKPMRYNDNYASASVTAAPSDTATQRDYFLGRLDQANNYRKDRKLADFFNLNVDNTPKTYKELIDAIKGDKFKLNEKRVKVLDAYTDGVDYDEDFGGINCGPFDGIMWDGPQADRAGYDAAQKEKDRLYVIAKDTVMSGDASAMAKAVQDFDAWMPTTATATVQ